MNEEQARATAPNAEAALEITGSAKAKAKKGRFVMGTRVIRGDDETDMVVPGNAVYRSAPSRIATIGETVPIRSDSPAESDPEQEDSPN